MCLVYLITCRYLPLFNKKKKKKKKKKELHYILERKEYTFQLKKRILKIKRTTLTHLLIFYHKMLPVFLEIGFPETDLKYIFDVLPMHIIGCSGGTIYSTAILNISYKSTIFSLGLRGGGGGNLNMYFSTLIL